MIETRRLRIFMATIEPTDFDGERDVWLGFNTTDGRMPLVCVSAVVNPCPGDGEFPPLLCWLETSAVYRRQRYATELLQAIYDYYGALSGTTPDFACSDEGEAFTRRFFGGNANE